MEKIELIKTDKQPVLDTFAIFSKLNLKGKTLVEK